MDSCTTCVIIDQYYSQHTSQYSKSKWNFVIRCDECPNALALKMNAWLNSIQQRRVSYHISGNEGGIDRYMLQYSRDINKVITSARRRDKEYLSNYQSWTKEQDTETRLTKSLQEEIFTGEGKKLDWIVTKIIKLYTVIMKWGSVRIYQHLSRSTYMARANEYTAGGSAPQPDKDQTARPGLAGILHTMHPA